MLFTTALGLPIDVPTWLVPQRLGYIRNWKASAKKSDNSNIPSILGMCTALTQHPARSIT